MAKKGFRPGVGNIATYTEGKLKEKINQYAPAGGSTDVSNLTTKISSSYDSHNNLAGDLVIEKTLNVSGNFSTAGNISGSGKGYFEKDVEIADNLLVSGSGTFVGNLSSSGKAYFEKDVEIADNLSISGSVTIGADADGTDRTITFGHSTLKTTIGIDDSGDVFAINTDNAFEAANDLQIDASGHVTLGNGNLVIGADADGTDRTITFGHSTLKSTIGIDDSGDVFAINTDNAFEAANDLQIDTNGNVSLGNGGISVAGNISGSGKGYFEKDVEIADSLLVSGSSTIVGTANVGRISGSTAQSSVLLGDLVIGAKDGTNAGIYVSGSANIDKSVYALKFSGSSANTSTLLGDLILGSKDGTAANLVVSGAATIGGDLTVNGTTTTVNSTTVTVDDPIFTLGGDTAPGSDDNKDRGIEFRWHNGSTAKAGFFGFDDSTGYFTFIPDASNSSEVFSGTKGTVDVGGLIASGIISGSGKAYFEKDVEIADNLLVTGSATVGSLVANGIISGSGKAYFEKDLEIADNLLVTGSVTSKGNVTIGADADGTDRMITFGHSTLKSVIGIDDSGDVFAINTDNAFEAANDLQIDANGHVTLGNGNLIVGADADGTDRTITFGHSTLKSVIGIDDSSDVFAINTDDAFESGNDFEIDTAGNTTISHGRLQVLGTEGVMSTRISGSGKGYFEKDVEMADNLKVTGSATVGSLVANGVISGSGKAYFEKDVEIADNLKVTGSATIGSAATNTFTINSAGRVSGSAGAIFEGDIVTADNLAATGSVTAASAIIAGNISGSGKGYFEKDVEIADNLLVSGSLTVGADADGTDRTITFGHSTLKTTVGIDDSGDVFAINTDDAFEAANDLQIDANGHVTLGNGNLIIGADADGADRTITFGHSTLKSTIGIDDSGDVFAINTDNAFEAANDLQIDANGNVSLGNGNLSIGADADGTDRMITFGHSTLKSVIGIDDSSDVFAINTDDAFESGNDFEIDTAGNTTVSHGRLQVLGTEGVMSTRISGSGKGYFEKDVEIADNLYVTGNVGVGTNNPSSPLHVKSTSLGVSVIIDAGNNGSGTNYDAALALASNGTTYWQVMNDAQNGSANRFLIRDAASPTRIPVIIEQNASEESIVLKSTGLLSSSVGAVFANDVIVGKADGGDNANLIVSGSLSVGTTSTLSASINTNGNIRDVKYSNGSGARSSLRLAKARGSEASPAAVTNAHSVGQVEFSAYDGANYVECASIVAKISGTPGSDDMPGALHFATTADGAKEVSDRMVITEAGNLYVSGNVKVPDDKKLYFGTNNDAYIEYEEGNQDFLVISGSDAGMVLSGSTVQIRGTLEGASPLKIAGGIEIVPKSNGESTSMKFGDNIRTTWGDDDDVGIQFKDGTLNFMEISGSSKGIVMSGSFVSIDGYLGVGVRAENGAITHGVTLPNNSGVAGKVKANSYTTYSSARYKDNIQPIQNALDTLSSIEGVTYRWKNNDLEDVGFVAEDVGKVLPQIVEWESDGVNAQSMDYTRITPVLVEAVKEQQVQIKKQKKLIEQLFEKIEKLKKDS